MMENAITDFRQLAAYINDKVKDENAMRLLTGMPESSARDLRSISQIYRFLQITFVAAYCKWLNCGTTSSRQGNFKHAQRVVELFELLYKAEPYSLDVVIYVLTEIKRDVIENENSLFRDVLTREPREYSRYYGFIYEWKNKFNCSLTKSEDLFEFVGSLVKDMLFIKDFGVIVRDKKIYLKIAGNEYLAYDLLMKDENGCWYILKERSVFGDSRYTTYINLDDYSEKNSIVRYY